MKTYDILNAGPRNRFMANGRIVSNSGRAIQLQNLVRNDLTTLDETRELIKMGCFDMVASIYGNVPDILSQLIRTMLIPKPGCEFIVADFSAIEARVLAWLSGEQWRLDAFNRGEDIYCASASAMFGVPVVKHGINGELRAKGKVAELACIAEGQLVLTDRGLIPIEDVSVDMKIWDGEEWVSHDGVVFKGEREVITYEGLTATPDHTVYIEGQSRAIRFDFAAASGAHLIQTGDGGRAVRLGKNNQPRETMGSRLASMLRLNRMSRMWGRSMAKFLQPKIGKIKRLSKLHSATTNSLLVRSETYGSQTAVRKSERSRILELWRKRNKIRFSKCDRSGTLFNSKLWNTGQRLGDRSYRQQWRLCSREYSLRDKERELCQQTNNCFKPIRSRLLAIFRSSRKKETLGRVKQRQDYPRCENCRIRETEELAWHRKTVKVYDILNAGRYHRFTVSGKLVHNCGYQGGVGALTAMGALDMGLKEDDLPKLISDWRQANPNIVKFWWDLEQAATETTKDHQERTVGKINVQYYANTLWLVLPSCRKLAYINPKLAPNRFGRMSLTYEGLNAANKWDHIESYGGKLAENCIAKGSLVLTIRGLIPIENVKLSDQVWDGVEWVHHEGIIYKGIQETIEVSCNGQYEFTGLPRFSGLHMTPEHKILTTEGWRECGKSGGLNWADVSLPDGSEASRKQCAGQSTMVVHQSKFQEQVYDIRNCGPRHRFAVWEPGTGCLRIVSNCTQATSRDLLAEAMWRMEQAGLDIVTHIHDEVVLEVPMNTVTVDDVCKIMNQNPVWAEDLPLASAGYRGSYYFKD